EELTSHGQYLGGFPLHPSSSATSVRVRDGKRLVTDGPFAETREQLGGYMIIDVKDLDEAIAIAARIPLARTSTVEIRPVREGPPRGGTNEETTMRFMMFVCADKNTEAGVLPSKELVAAM